MNKGATEGVHALHLRTARLHARHVDGAKVVLTRICHVYEPFPTGIDLNPYDMEPFALLHVAHQLETGILVRRFYGRLLATRRW
jgi:hypothetical protein